MIFMVGVWSTDEEIHYGNLNMEVLPRVGETLCMLDDENKIHSLLVKKVYHSYVHAQQELKRNPMAEHADGRVYLHVIPEI